MENIDRDEKFASKPELEAYVEEKLENGYIVADFKSEQFFEVAAHNLGEDLIRINDKWIKDGKFPEVHLEALILIKKGEKLNMLLGGNPKENDKLIYVLFHEGGVGEGSFVKEGDVTAYKDFATYTVGKHFSRGRYNFLS